MAIPDLEFPALGPDRVLEIWAALKRILQTDPNLKIATLRLWEGGVEDAYPPTVQEMPWVRVTPTNTPMQLGSEVEWLVDLQFRYELAVQGTKIENLILLFGAFRKALAFNAPVGDSNALAVLRAAGATVHAFRTAAIAPLRARDVNPSGGAEPPPPEHLAGVGIFNIRAIIPAIV